MLDALIPTPRLIELNTVDLEASPAAVWEHLRWGDLGDSPLVHGLFALRTLPSRLFGNPPPSAAFLKLEQLRSTPEHPGFQLLHEQPERSLTVGAIGQVWQLDIPFRHVDEPLKYAKFAEPGWIKVAWELRLTPIANSATRLEFEVRVDATDDASWVKFTRYWKLIGAGSHFIRHIVLGDLKRRFGAADLNEEKRPLQGDELLPDAHGQSTQGITIRATPEAIWPWLLQMGCQRGGFYSIDMIDNGAKPSAREIHPELQQLSIGQIIPATTDSSEGFEVLAIYPERALILGGLFDVAAAKQIPFLSQRPKGYWHVTWAFVLERVDETSTRLHVRARVAFSTSEKFHVAWIRPVHALMQYSQLRNLAARAEGRLARDTLSDVAEGLTGAAVMALALVTPFLRSARNHWGLSEQEALRPRAGDQLIAAPLWSWTHAVEIDATPERVWPWVAQIGADRAGFYSYQWLENLAGCNVTNAETIHADWVHQAGDNLVLHPQVPPIPVVSVEPGQSLLAFTPADEAAKATGRPWTAASWAFLLEPLEHGRCRLVSRFRSNCSEDLVTRLAQGPMLLEPVGFAMDRRMLLGIKARAEDMT